MTNKSISQLNAGVAVTSTDLFPDVQTVGVGPVKVTAAQIGEYVLTGSGLTGILPVARGGTGLSTMTAANNALYSTSSSTVAAGTLPVAAGGTGLTTLTAGYIPFGNGTSAFGNSSNLFWDSANNRLGVGISSPSTTFEVVGTSTIDGDSIISNFGAAGSLFLKKALGTISSPTAASGNISRIYSMGYDGTSAYQYVGEIRFFSDTTITSSSSAGGMAFFTTPSGSTTQSERLRIDSSGNVGIGTSSPGALLHLASSSASTGFRITNSGTLYVDCYANSSNTVFNNVAATPLTFGTNNTERMRIDSSGNVGIGGTPSGVAPLDVDKVNNFACAAKFGASLPVYINANNPDVGFNMYWGGSGWLYGKGSSANYAGNINFDCTSGLFAFQSTTGTGNAGAAVSGLVNRLVIDSSGNVGIGTSSPGSKLSVASGNIQVETTYGIVLSGGTTNGYFVDDSSVGGKIQTGGGFRIFTGGANERLRIDSSGNVGIGTSSPSAKLDVTGVARVTSSILTNSDLQVNPTGYNLYLRNIGGINRIDSYNSPITSTAPLQINASLMTFLIADAEKMRIDSAGNVGIGTTSMKAGGTLNVFSGMTILNNGGNSPYYNFYNGNAATDKRTWRIGNLADGSLSIETVNDAYSAVNIRMAIDAAGNVIVGTAAIATNATDGFLYIPTCAGAATGTATSYTGRAPMVVDSTNNRLYIRVGSTWKYATLN